MKFFGKMLVWLSTAALLTLGLLYLLDIPLSVKRQETETETKTAAEQVNNTLTAGVAKDLSSVAVEERLAGQKDTVQKKDLDTVQKSGNQEDEEDEKKLLEETVGDDYFADALFIGDSRTVGIQESGLLPEATYYAKVGIGIGELLEEAIIYENGMMLTIPQALQLHSFGKVYVMIGINDMSKGDVDWFLEKYKEILEVVRETQPEAVIYIQGNIPMAYYKQEADSSEGALTNANLRERNTASRRLADGKLVFYLDTQDIYADSYGNLNTIYTTDGLHVKLSDYDLWMDYLKQHARVWSGKVE